MSLPPGYIRVTKARPCPICGKPDWCLIHRDAVKVCCARVESRKPYGDAGWLHTVDEKLTDLPVVQPKKRLIGINIEALANRYKRAMDGHRLYEAVTSLGIGADTLHNLRMGWSSADQAFSFPMRDWTGKFVGIRLRGGDGRKWSVRGSKEGLFYWPLGIHEATSIFITEGPTDTGALMDLGVAVVGRPSCNGAAADILKMVGKKHNIIIVADHDGPGQRGAESLANKLMGFAGSVKIIEPVVGKDIRVWKTQSRASIQWLMRVVENAEPWTGHARK